MPWQIHKMRSRLCKIGLVVVPKATYTVSILSQFNNALSRLEFSADGPIHAARNRPDTRHPRI